MRKDFYLGEDMALGLRLGNVGENVCTGIYTGNGTYK